MRRHGSEVFGVCLILAAFGLLYLVAKDGTLTVVEASAALGVGVAGGFCISKTKTKELIAMLVSAIPTVRGGPDA